MTPTARLVAYQTLMRVHEDAAYTNVALQHALNRSKLEVRDKGLATEIVYGTVRRQITLDAVLQPFVKRKLETLDASVLTLLRMSVYQLGYLTRVPSYAVIDEAVELAKRYARPASGFVNGVLRSFQRSGLTMEERIMALTDKLDSSAQAVRLGIRHGYPTWMVSQLLDAYGMERTERILAVGNEPAPLTVRVNRLKSTLADVRAGFTQIGHDAVEPGLLSPDALYIHAPLEVDRHRMYRDGLLSVQDEGAMLIAPLLQAAPDMRVLDLCAAPGGKTTHIAELQSDAGQIDAFDVYLQKVRVIQEACTRLGLQSITARLGDGRDAGKRADRYDAVLVDAPCSGLGVMRRRPDVRHRRKQTDIATLNRLQTELLASACQATRSGGVIVYATCTLLPEENDHVVDRVIQESGGTVVLEDISDSLPAPVQSAVVDGRLTLTPDLYNTDGFYMARLRRK